MTSTAALMLKFGRVLGIVGADVVMAKLDEVEQSAPNSYYKSVETFVISEVCAKYSTSKNELTKPRLYGDQLTASKMCFVLLSTHLPEYSHRTIGKIFGKSNMPVSNALKEFSSMGTKVKHEREFLESYNDLNERVKSFVNKIEP